MQVHIASVTNKLEMDRLILSICDCVTEIHDNISLFLKVWFVIHIS